MLRSMTGFGRGTGRAGANPPTEATVEVRAVNGRHAEVTVRAPRELAPHEAALQARVREALGRGSVTVHVALRRGGAAPVARVDAAAACAVARLLDRLRFEAGLDPATAPITLDHLLRFPEVLAAPDDDPAADDARRAEALAATEAALEAALAETDAMRRREGEALARDLAARTDALEAHLAAVEARAPARVAEARERLTARLAALLGNPPEAPRLDPARLEAEVALLADRLDVTEECVRLRSHLAQFRAALATADAGRRLGFLVQELGREVNTIGS
ncbi:MAG: YicC family protein, partial [Rubricoccaceae bacterium]